MQHRKRLFGILFLSAFAGHLALADSLYSFADVNDTFIDNPVTLGFIFTANASFDVTSLGWFDGSGTGFQTQHTVGIFDADGNLLASATLGTGTGEPLSSWFRYQAIAPTILEAGSTYTLAGTSGGSLDA